ncbi:PaaI family thioesterase [Cohnella lubricantis]|uniref:Acyl-coenzyme A thioesterase THEM4 n=1 Tax=Cohnella lubricantis TaxID=2163172 RepID=A0A841T996_9BACL|nr:PaaI family thioesterase [Cohnella lubricantis]MBB6675820.1 PaaI family thioesterase [Cohnella lubricantis]MBP2119770.1 uncharacterized protein (TIGR00369 family) [Cohnella lubricantis]
MELNTCYVCGKDNPRGLHISFEPSGDGAVAYYRCREEMNGWPGIQHGGITASLLDEAAGYVPYFLGLVAVTAKLEIRYMQPIKSGELLTITGKPIKRTSRTIEVESTIASENGEIKAQSIALMKILNERQREQLGLGGLL